MTVQQNLKDAIRNSVSLKGSMKEAEAVRLLAKTREIRKNWRSSDAKASAL